MNKPTTKDLEFEFTYEQLCYHDRQMYQKGYRAGRKKGFDVGYDWDDRWNYEGQTGLVRGAEGHDAGGNGGKNG